MWGTPHTKPNKEALFFLSFIGYLLVSRSLKFKECCINEKVGKISRYFGKMKPYQQFVMCLNVLTQAVS